jgi:predicted 2-oxoglutarate/Fe(II)-dependent dioxygenase YbiX
VKTLSSHIGHYPGYAPSTLCERIIAEFENDISWERGRTSVESGHRMCDLLPISASGRQQLDSELFQVVHEVVKVHIENIPFVNLSGDSGYDLLRYNKGDFYEYHVDHGDVGAHNRTLSLIINLSSAADYRGGKLQFKNGPSFSLDQGDVVIFPSNFLFPHRISRVTSGTRYSIVTWLQ